MLDYIVDWNLVVRNNEKKCECFCECYHEVERISRRVTERAYLFAVTIVEYILGDFVANVVVDESGIVHTMSRPREVDELTASFGIDYSIEIGYVVIVFEFCFGFKKLRSA